MRSTAEKAEQSIRRSPVGEYIADIVLTRWHTGYMRKSAGVQDEFGNGWKRLALVTLAEKRRRRAGGWREMDRASMWKRRHGQLVKQLLSAGFSMEDAQDKATDLAWGSAGVPINIDTTRLITSLDPGYSGPDQVREVSDEVVRLGTEVEYAKYVNKQRRILPNQAEVRAWLREVAEGIRTQVIRDVA